MENTEIQMLVLEFSRKTEKELRLEVWFNPLSLRYVENQTEELCLTAVAQAGYSLEYVRNQSEAICLEAVKQNYRALEFVKKSNLELI